MTVKKWGAMRQSIDLNGKKECRGEAVTVMVHGSFVRFCDSNSFTSHSARLLEPSFRTDLFARHSSNVAVMQHPKPRAESFAYDLIGQSRLADGKLDKNSSQACDAQSAAFQTEGASSSGCCNAAPNLTTQNPEQRCCAAA